MPREKGFIPEEEYNEMEAITPEIDKARNWGTKGLLESLDETLQKLERKAREELPAADLSDARKPDSEKEPMRSEKELLDSIKRLRDIISQKADEANAKYEKLSHVFDRRSRDVYKAAAKIQQEAVRAMNERANDLFEEENLSECENVLKLMITYFNETVLSKE